MPKAHHFVPPLLVLLLGTAFAGSAQAGWFDFGAKPKAEPVKQTDTKPVPAAPAETLEESIRQAEMLRLAGNYPEAVKHLSQLMMVASDDPRVVAEYGKTLAAMGRASDAVNFLTRAQQLQPNDWTVYSALGVAYDQVGNQREAQGAYEHALAIKPGEPSVLSNYAFSRLLAKDADMARNLAGRAEIANASTHDQKIARNIAMIRSMVPEKAAADAGFVVNRPAPSPALQRSNGAPANAAPRQMSMPQPPVPQQMAMQPLPAPQIPVQQRAMQQLPMPAPQMALAPITPAPVFDNRVVMQRVPVDPLAGPVGPAIHAPRALQPKPVARAEAPTEPKPEMSKVTSAPAKPLTDAESLEARAEALAKTLANRPEAIAAAKAQASKGMMAAKPEAPKPQAKTAESKPVQAAPSPKVLPAAPSKPAVVKAAGGKTDPKNTIPGLRLSANAY